MSYETLFSLSSLGVMPFWLLMVVLPTWKWTRRIISSPWIALVPVVIYVALVLPQVGSVFAQVSDPTVESIAALLGTPAGATIAWAHFLAFDLLVGRWEYLDSRERGIHPLLMVAPLFLTLMLGPVGLLLYLLVRAGYAFAGRGAPQPAVA